MYPTKEYLEGKWWHRLAKTIFVFLTLGLLLGSVFVFYLVEETNAQEYRVVKTFSQFLDQFEEQHHENLPAGYVLDAPESFLAVRDLASYSLGCLRDDGRVDYLSEYSFKSDVSCDWIRARVFAPEDAKSAKPSKKAELIYVCNVPQTVCNGDASLVVKYDYVVDYKVENYAMVGVKAAAAVVCWILLAYVLYYKALLYIAFGKARKREGG